MSFFVLLSLNVVIMGLNLASAIHIASMGMKASEKSINVSGDNLANANTIGYKAERADFASFLAYNYHYGTTPDQGYSAGTNPTQIGMGVEFAGVSTDFSQGTFKEGMTNSDIAINGNGFLIVQAPNDTRQYYTRNGALKVNGNLDLVTNTGMYVMGYGIDDKFRIQTDTLTNLRIPIGEMHIAEVTQHITIEGIVDAVGDAGTQGTVLRTAPMTDLSKSLPASGQHLTATTLPVPNVETIGIVGETTGTGTVESGTYYYSFVFVDANGVESDYSAPTNPITVQPGQNAVSLTGLPEIPDGYSSLRIYRAVYSGNATESHPFYQVAETASGVNSFTDTRSTASITDPTQPDYRQLDQERLSAKESYTYYMTYTDDAGNESRPVAVSDEILLNLGGQLSLSEIPTVDPANNPDGWTGRRIYRSSGVDSTDIRLVGEIPNMNPDATIIDRTSDAALLNNIEISEAGRGNVLINSTTRLLDVGKFENGHFVRVFEEGTLTLKPNKGGEELRWETLEITAETTVGDYENFLNESFGIRNAADGIPPDQGILGQLINNGSQGAATMDGSLYFLGNSGVENTLELDANDMILQTTDGVTRQIDLGWGQDPNNKQDAVGASVASDLQVFDSLGTPIDVRLTMVLESKSNTETIYRWYADSSSNQPVDGSAIASGTGTIRFDQNGRLIDATNTRISVQRTQTAATSPLDFEFEMNLDALMALATETPELQQTTNDGAGAGTLYDFTIDKDGTIWGIFDSLGGNTQRTIGQIPLATFRNQEGLFKSGESLYQVSTNSGDPIIGIAGSGGVGTIKSNSLELSNTDIGGEIVNMILASAMYRANAKIMTTSNEMMDALLRIT
ncbi:MAG: flagellar hook-basal body complex protein [Planctomycetaceae bacterium]|jgi:flagellar hook protein FlgE|nr:flagellar hook-basal body complex protein [Planctomycetaceae bacterium]